MLAPDDAQLSSSDARGGLSRPPAAERSEASEGVVGFRIVETSPIDALADGGAALGRRWRDILDRAAQLDPPARLDPPATFAAALASRCPGVRARSSSTTPAQFRKSAPPFPDAAVGTWPEAEWPIDLDAVFDEALSETIALPGGGSVHIETTRAGMLIDVDTGTPETGSPERAATGGQPRRRRDDRPADPAAQSWAAASSSILSDWTAGRRASGCARRSPRRSRPDPAAPQVLGWTRLGHFELVRPRRGRPLAEALLEPRDGGALVKTAVTVAHEALRALRREARAQPGRRWRLTVAPDVAAALAGSAAAAVQEAERRFARRNRDRGRFRHRDRERFQISAL